MITMDDFLKSENEIRVDRYSKSLHDEEFLVRLNAELESLEESMCDEKAPDVPNIYIFGLPRSGTTLLYQLIAHALDVAWPTNLMARFWKAPVVGMHLSKIIGLFDERIDFASDCGLTKGAHGPHEFGYFWMKWLTYKDTIQKTREHDKTIPWEGLQHKLNSISKEAGKSVVYKNILYSFHLERFIQIQKDSLFIYCKRNLPDIATSIFFTRKKRYGAERIWWSAKPHGFKKEFLNKGPIEQITYQVKSFTTYFNNILEILPKDNVKTITYDNLYSEFDKLVYWIIHKCQIDRKNERIPKIVPKTFFGTKEYQVFSKLL